jgi:hypothetical protein
MAPNPLPVFLLPVCMYSSPTVHSLTGEGAGGHKSYNTEILALYTLYGDYIKARKFRFTAKILIQYFSMGENFSYSAIFVSNFQDGK